MSKPDKKAANQKPGKIVLLPVEQIEPSPFQARTAFDETEIAALAVSILQNGLLQPISVRKACSRPPEPKSNSFILIIGLICRYTNVRVRHRICGICSYL